MQEKVDCGPAVSDGVKWGEGVHKGGTTGQSVGLGGFNVWRVQPEGTRGDQEGRGTRGTKRIQIGASGQPKGGGEGRGMNKARRAGRRAARAEAGGIKRGW